MVKKILIAEDDKFLSKIYLEKLKKEGYEVKLASDGEQAVNETVSFMPDLVILDLIMPKKTGFDVLRELKIKPETKSIPVIIFSNLEQESDMRKVKDLGAVDYVVKGGVTFNEVLEKIIKYTTQ